jgi:osmotically-inducible protein OsmY
MRLLSVFLMLSVLLASGSQLWAQKQISDDQIYDQVRRKLASDPVVKGGALEVEVQDGVVTLRGKVKEEKQKNKAGRITKKVKGVKRVINELVISPTG